MAQTPISPVQDNPAADTDVELYDVPDSSSLIGWVSIANRSATATRFRLWIEVDNAATADDQYIAYDVPIAGNESLPQAYRVTMTADDRLMIRADDATLSFSLFGVSIT